MSIQEIETKCVEFKKWKRLAEEAEALADSIGDELKALMTEAGKEKMIAGAFKLSYTDVSRTDLDKKKLKEEEEAIFEKYSYSTIYKRFTVS